MTPSRRSKFIRTAAIAGLAGLLASASSHAVVVFSFQDVGTSLVGQLSGTLNLTGAANDGLATSSGAAFNTAGLTASAPARIQVVASGPPSSQPRAKAWFIDLPATFPVLAGASAVNQTNGTLASPGIFELLHIADSPTSANGMLYLDANYTSGSPLSQTITFANTSLAGLHIQPGSYVYTLRGTQETITLAFGVAAVPEPQAVLMMLLGLGLVAGVAKPRRQPAADA